MSLDTKDDRKRLDGSDDSLGGTFYPLFQLLFDEDGEFVKDIESKLAQARMANNAEMFLSRALAVGFIAGFGLWLVGVGVGWLFVEAFVDPQGPIIGIQFPALLDPIVQALKVPLVLFIAGLLFGSIGFAIGFGSLVSIPYFRAGARKREINVLLADSVSFMYALSVGGMNQLEILRAMAKADDTYGEVAKEFQSIVLETEYFDTDYRTAIRNQSLETPSDELAQFLTDMLSIINSGGNMTAFLEDQKDKHMRTAKKEQKKQLDTLELFGEMYMTLSLFPLLLIIILVIMDMMEPGGQEQLLFGTVYGLIPLVGIGFLVLVSTVTQDETGDGYLRPDSGETFTVDEGIGVFNPGLVEQFTGNRSVFDKIKRREGTHELIDILKAPHIFFRDHPTMVLVVTVPLTILTLIGAVATGNAPNPVSQQAMVDNMLLGAVIWIYVPVYLNLLPLAVFYEWNVRSRSVVLSNLSENLRKLSSANDTGMTLLESVKVVSETSSGKLATEFETMHAKVKYGTNLKDALREFNNKFHIPRLARTVKLISEAQETSSQIEDVLSTAAKASENQDDIDRERKTRTRMQMVIIIMTFLTLLAVMALLRVQFLDTMEGLGGGSIQNAENPSTSEGLDADLMSMLFFHAVTLQALISSFIAGYIRNVELMSGVKYAVALSTITLITWVTVEQIAGGGSEEALLLLIGSAGVSLRDLWGCRPTPTDTQRGRKDQEGDSTPAKSQSRKNTVSER